MRYIYASKEKAVRKGFIEAFHRRNGKYMLLNEREVMLSVGLSGDLAERVEQLGGEVYTLKEVMLKRTKKGKYKL